MSPGGWAKRWINCKPYYKQGQNKVMTQTDWCGRYWKGWAGHGQWLGQQGRVLQAGTAPGEGWDSPAEWEGAPLDMKGLPLLCAVCFRKSQLPTWHCNLGNHGRNRQELEFNSPPPQALWKCRIPSDSSLVWSQNNQLLQIRERDLNGRKADKTNASSHNCYLENVLNLNSAQSLIG